MEVREALTDEEVNAALALRSRVFCEEQGVSFEADQDGRDPEATHIVAIDDGAVIGIVELERGTARIETCHVAHTDESYEAGAKLAQKLVAPDLRGVLVLSDGSIVNGSALVRAAEETLRVLG